jgi:methionine biosynthesis protein MetW
MPSRTGVARRVARLTGPAPLNDFPDYDAYWVERGGLGEVIERWRIAVELIPDGASVLDVGCGSAEFLNYLRTERPNVKATGIDISQVAVQRARDSGFEAYQLDLTREDIRGTFDYVTAFEVIEHIPNAEAALARIKAAARRQVIMSLPNVGSIENRLRLGLFGRFPVTNCIFHMNEHVRFWTVRDFREWAERYGMRVVRVYGQGGITFLPWRRFPGLLSEAVVYLLEPMGTPLS